MARWETYRPWLGTVFRLLLGVVWIWAATSKLSKPLEFVQAVRAYDATPEWLSKAIGYGLPVLELGLGVVLIVGVTVRIAAAVSAVLFVVFLIGLIQASARGISLECGCFGGGGTTEGSTSYTLDILRDIGLLIAAVYLVVWSYTRLSVEEYLARNDSVPMPSAKRMRTPEGRKRYEAQVAMARATARGRSMWLDGSIVGIVVLVALIGIGVQANRAKITDVIPGKFASVNNGIAFGKKAAATVDVYEDFGCPICKEFETATHVELEKDVRANLAQVRYHPISILDRTSPNEYSTRAANAAICVSDAGIEAFIKYHDVLYGGTGAASVQPTEGTAGPSDSKLIALANQMGVLTAGEKTTLNDCVSAGQYDPLVAKMTDTASQKGVTGTPTIYVNGSKLADNGATTLFNAIKKANVGHTPVPSKTPTPKPTPSTSVTPSVTPTTKAGSGSSSGSPSGSSSVSPSSSAGGTPSKSSSVSSSKSPSGSPSKST